MTHVNWRRVFGGGLAAALVLGIHWLPLLFLLRDDGAAVFAALGLPLQVTTPMLVYGVVATPGLGILTMWLYAAIRPRYGAGPRTAVIAGFAVWLLTLLVDGGWPALGLVPMRLYVILKAADLAAFPLASLTGAWFYQEAPTKVRAA